MALSIIKVLSVTLGLFFIFVGVLKLSPVINKELYKEMRKQYIRMAKVFPLANYTGWKPNPHTYRKVVASSEVTCGIVLTIIPGPLKIAANVIMILVNANDVLANFQVKDGIQRMGLPIVFILLLSCRLVITAQEFVREREKAKEREKTEDKSKQQVTNQGETEELSSNQEEQALTADEKKMQ